MDKYTASDVITISALSLVVSTLLFLAFFWSTTPEHWYAGQHIKECNNSVNCSCYEKLLKNAKQN